MSPSKKSPSSSKFAANRCNISTNFADLSFRNLFLFSSTVMQVVQLVVPEEEEAEAEDEDEDDNLRPLTKTV